MAKPGKPQQGSAVKVVEALVRPVVEGMDLRLWDVRFEKEGPDWFLRVLIDRDEPLDTDTCEAVSRAIDPLLDEADPIEQSYYLEVGSPGLGRRLTRPEHYEQLKGQKCAAHLIRPDEQGRRDYAGILQGLDADGNVTLTDGEETYAFPVKSAGFVPRCAPAYRVAFFDWGGWLLGAGQARPAAFPQTRFCPSVQGRTCPAPTEANPLKGRQESDCNYCIACT